MTPRVTLVLGGARSGKSAWAERLVGAAGGPVVYLATATAGDAEMVARIAQHRERRPPAWRTVEAAHDLPSAVRQHAAAGASMLVDCLSLWVSNELLRWLGSNDPDAVPANDWTQLDRVLVGGVDETIDAARTAGVSLVLVSNEVGMGIVPPYPLGRHFRDLLGRVNQAAATGADDVHLMVAGQPIDLRKVRAELSGTS